jgi:hypothetical protein
MEIQHYQAWWVSAEDAPEFELRQRQPKQAKYASNDTPSK